MIPIIYIHQGHCDYLRYTLDSARLFNPDKEVYLLGDDDTKWVSRIGIRHIQYRDFESGEELAAFNKVATFDSPTVKPESIRPFWFRRWFYMYNFAMAWGLKSFWTFDSDTLILTRLSAQEHKFLQYDCTEQCNGACMNGFINNMDTVKGYLLFMIEHFRSGRANTDDSTCNEMYAYVHYKNTNSFRTIELNTIIDGETFDSNISECHDMEMSEDGRTKKMYVEQHGNLYTRHLPTGLFVRLNTINMSWVPASYVGDLYFHSLKKLNQC